MKKFLVVLSPFLLALLIMLILQLTWSPVLVFKADIGSAIAVIGFLIAMLVFMIVIGREWGRRDSKHQIESIQQAESESRRRFFRRLDHELKNPLTGLRAAFVNLRETSGEERDQTLINAQREVDRLSRLVADLRKLSELDERPLEQSPVDLNDLLSEMIEAARSNPAYSGRSISLSVVNVPWALPKVTGDVDLLGLAFYNLIENALKFTAPDDRIEVRARAENRALIVEIADTGAGIPQDDAARLFEELYRGANARGVEGSGLGLALVQRIIRRHGGEVNVHSRVDGSRGTVFTVSLPIKS